jgi:DNA-binding response OmpR family regulator
MTRSILVVEDDRDIANLLRIHLQDLGHTVDLAYDGRSGLARAEAKPYDLVILDLMLPGLEGLEVCRQLRARQIYTPILILTAKSSEIDRVLGLEMGADDYLTKPFSIRELVARVKAILRRADLLAAQAAQTTKTVDAGDLFIDMDKRTVTVKGTPVDLTPREFDLLAHFAQHPGRVYSREQLLNQVWGYGHEGYEHTVNTHINRLRTKIENDPTRPRYILTVWGVGYKFSEAENRAESV